MSLYVLVLIFIFTYVHLLRSIREQRLKLLWYSGFLISIDDMLVVSLFETKGTPHATHSSWWKTDGHWFVS